MNNGANPKSVVNKGYVYGYATIISLGGLIYVYSVSVMNSSYKAIQKINEWPEDTYYESLVVSLVPFGAILGAMINGFAVSWFGRRSLILLLCLIMAIGVFLCMNGDYIFFCIGRLLQGFCVGSYASLCPLYIREISPAEISGTLGSFFSVAMRSGNLVTFGVAMILPAAHLVTELDQRWRIVIGFPLIIVGVQAAFLKFLYRYETPKGSLILNNKDQCRKILSLMYSSESRVEKEVVDAEKALIETKGKDVLFCELFGPYFRRLTMIGLVMKFCHSLSGYTAVLLYSTSILADPSDESSAKRVTVLIGFANVIAVFIFLFIVDIVGRRKILILGSFAVSFLNISIGVSLKFEFVTIAGALIIIFMLVYSSSLGPAPWVLLGEILPPKAMSISIMFGWMMTTLLSFSFKPLAEKLGTQAIFYSFGAINLFTGVFSLIYIKETKGNNEMENRLAYSNDKLKQERLQLINEKMGNSKV